MAKQTSKFQPPAAVHQLQPRDANGLAPVTVVQVFPEADLLVSADEAGILRLWRLSSWEVVFTLQLRGGEVGALCWSSEPGFIFVGVGCSVQLVQLPVSFPSQSLGVEGVTVGTFEEEVAHLSFHRGWLVAADDSGSVSVAHFPSLPETTLDRNVEDSPPPTPNLPEFQWTSSSRKHSNLCSSTAIWYDPRDTPSQLISVVSGGMDCFLYTHTLSLRPEPRLATLGSLRTNSGQVAAQMVNPAFVHSIDVLQWDPDQYFPTVGTCSRCQAPVTSKDPSSTVPPRQTFLAAGLGSGETRVYACMPPPPEAPPARDPLVSADSPNLRDRLRQRIGRGSSGRALRKKTKKQLEIERLRQELERRTQELEEEAEQEAASRLELRAILVDRPSPIATVSWLRPPQPSQGMSSFSEVLLSSITGDGRVCIWRVSQILEQLEIPTGNLPSLCDNCSMNQAESPSEDPKVEEPTEHHSRPKEMDQAAKSKSKKSRKKKKKKKAQRQQQSESKASPPIVIDLSVADFEEDRQPPSLVFHRFRHPHKVNWVSTSVGRDTLQMYVADVTPVVTAYTLSSPAHP